MTEDNSDSMYVNVTDGTQILPSSADNSGGDAQQQGALGPPQQPPAFAGGGSVTDPQPGPSGIGATGHCPGSDDTTENCGLTSTNSTTDSTDINNNKSNSSQSFLDMTFSAIAKHFHPKRKDATPPPAQDAPVMVMADPSVPLNTGQGPKTPKTPDCQADLK